jgi:hypothetical protein
MKARTIVLLAIIVVASLSRLAPHPPNFAPITAMALFGAAYFRSLWAAFLVPQTIMLATDLGLDLANRMGWLGSWLGLGVGFYGAMWGVYLAFFLISCLGLLIRRWKNIPCVAGATLASSCVFFLVSNFAFWLWWYPHTKACRLVTSLRSPSSAGRLWATPFSSSSCSAALPWRNDLSPPCGRHRKAPFKFLAVDKLGFNLDRTSTRREDSPWKEKP